MLAAISNQTSGSDQTESAAFTDADGSKRTVSFTRIPGTGSRLVVSVDEAKVAASTNREIRTAYLELGLVCLLVLIGALIAAEKLIVQPIEMMAAMTVRFGQGDWSARAVRSRLPAEFIPLARAFNAMAMQLGQRERELIATNDRLIVMASMDMLSGLANRRGFQSRLDFEWMKAQQQNDNDLSLLMIDVDHFKLSTPPKISVLPGVMAARNFACCCQIPRSGAQCRSARPCAWRSRRSRCLIPPATIRPSPSASGWLAPIPMAHTGRAI
jgi:diguanylate cyclase with GGDEF domain/HAMP domain-containing protein